MKAEITNLDHIAVVVKNLEQALDFYSRVLGLEVVHEETVESEGIRAAFVRIGSSTIELMEPVDPNCHVAKHLKKYGQGFAHLCFATRNIEAVKQRLEDEDLFVLGQGIKKGAQDRKIFFLHPKDNAGVLTEFCQLEEDSKNKKNEL